MSRHLPHRANLGCSCSHSPATAPTVSRETPAPTLDKAANFRCTLIVMDSLKLVDVDKGLIEGWAIPFGGPMPGGKDLDGEAFTKDTKLFLDAYDKRPLLYLHGMDKALGATSVGDEIKWEQKDGGVWLEAQLSKSAKYQEHILELARRGLLSYSSGANPRSVVKSASGMIESWMWNETSVVPIPSNPFGMITMKALGLTEPMALSDQVQVCEKMGHFPDAGEVATWMAENGKTEKAAFSDDMLERFVRLEMSNGEMASEVSELKWQLGVVQRQLNPDENKSVKELREENARLMEVINVPD